MKKIHFDLKIEAKTLPENIRYFMKNFMFFVSWNFLGNNKSKAHNLENHIIDFEKKVKINNKTLIKVKFSKYDIHFVDFWINIWNEINWYRPCLIFKNNRFATWYDTFVIPFTSSIDEKKKQKKLYNFDLIIEPDDNNNLKKTSILKIQQMQTISKNRIWRKIWKLENKNSIYEKIDSKIKKLMNLQ